VAPREQTLADAFGEPLRLDQRGEHTIQISVNLRPRWKRTIAVPAGKTTEVEFREELREWLDSMDDRDR